MKNVISSILTLATLSAAAGSLQAQDNVHPLQIVDRAGSPLPVQIDAVTGLSAAHSSVEAVYLALDPATPSGNYYVHVTDRLDGITDQVLSLNAPADRFVTVINLGGGVIDLFVPSNPSLEMGIGRNGLGESLPLGLLDESLEYPCLFKAWLGDTWATPVNPTWPYTVMSGPVRSYSYFRIGDGSGSSLSGVVFEDTDADGVQDANETGLGGIVVELDGPGGITSEISAADGSYSFTGLAGGSYTVTQIVDAQSGNVATTALSYARSAMGCGAVEGADFGQQLQAMACDARDVWFWRSCPGLAVVSGHGLLRELWSLNVVTICGWRYYTCSTWSFSRWMGGWSCWNMAYQLSQQVTAMHFNVEVGFVDENCMINDPCLGQISVRALLDQAIASLGCYPYTPWCHSQRAHQEKLKNALLNANRNLNWL